MKFDPPLRKETEAHHEMVCDSDVVLFLSELFVWLYLYDLILFLFHVGSAVRAPEHFGK